MERVAAEGGRVRFPAHGAGAHLSPAGETSSVTAKAVPTFGVNLPLSSATGGEGDLWTAIRQVDTKNKPRRRIARHYAALLRISNGVRPFFISMR